MEGRELAAHATFPTWRMGSQALVISTAGNVLSQTFGKVTPSMISPSKSLCFSAVGGVWASIPFPEQSLFTGEKEFDYSSPGSVREASVRRNSAVSEGRWLHTVGLIRVGAQEPAWEIG